MVIYTKVVKGKYDHRNLFLKRTILVIVLLLLGSSSSEAQWRKLWTFPDHVNCLYHVPGIIETYFAGLNNGQIWESTDDGQSWQQTMVPLNPPNTGISDFTFKNSDTGWASHIGYDGGVFMTTDGGEHWVDLTLPRKSQLMQYDGRAIYYNRYSHKLFFSSWIDDPTNGSWPTSMVSSDYGQSWSFFSRKNLAGYAFSDSVHGLCSMADPHETSWLVTTNGGISWLSVPFTLESWQPLAFPNTAILFAIGDSNNDFFRSDDYGIQWRKISRVPFTRPFGNTGSVYLGKCGNLFVGGDSLMTSADSGLSWISLGGPECNHPDERFIVDSSRIIVPTSTEDIWLLDLSSRVDVSTDAISIHTASACSPLDTFITLTNFYCEPASITSVSMQNDSVFTLEPTASFFIQRFDHRRISVHILPHHKGTFSNAINLQYQGEDGVHDTTITLNVIVDNEIPAPFLLSDSSIAFAPAKICTASDTITSITNQSCGPITIMGIDPPAGGQFIIPSLPGTPIILDPGMTLTLQIRFAPTVISSAPAKIGLHIKINGKLTDTVITLLGSSIDNSDGVRPDSTFIQLDTLSTCEQHPFVLPFTNFGCYYSLVDTVSSSNSDFQIQQFIPFSLQPTEHHALSIALNTIAAGLHRTTFTFKVSPTGKPVSTITVTIEVYLKAGVVNLLLPNKGVYSDTVTFCKTEIDTLFITATNASGCDSIHIDSCWLSGDPAFSLVGSKQFVVGPDSELTVPIQFNAITKGYHYPVLHYQYFNGSGWKDTSIQLIIVLKNGGTLLSVSDTTIDFGTLSYCDLRDSVIWLTNSGCDSITIKSATSLKRGFRSTLSLPATIGPDSSIAIHLSALPDSTFSKTTFTDTLFIQTSIDTKPRAVAVTYSVTPLIRLHLWLEIDKPAAEREQVVTVKLKTDPKSIASISKMSFSMKLNTDLLTSLSLTSPNTVSGFGTNDFTISHSPSITTESDSTIATFTYTVFLTSDSNTTIELSSFAANDIAPSSGPCALQAVIGGTVFDFTALCGDRLFQRVLSGKQPLEFSSIQPNPASSSLDIRIKSSLMTEGSLRMYSSSGLRVFEKQLSFKAGDNRLKVNIDNLPSGKYWLEAASGSSQIKEQITVIK